MDGLTPDKRRDRLGRWVTRWVRSARVKEGSSAIPAPTTGRAEAPDKSVRAALLKRGTEEQLDPGEARDLRRLIALTDPTQIPPDFWPSTLVRAFRGYRRDPHFHFTDEQAADCAVYYLLMPPRAATAENLRRAGEFFAAGVPAGIAANLVYTDGTVQQGLAIRDRAVPPGLSSGAL